MQYAADAVSTCFRKRDRMPKAIKICLIRGLVSQRQYGVIFKRDSVWESPLFKSCRTVTSVIDCLSEDCHRHEKNACLYHERMRQIQMSFSESYSQKRLNRKSPFQNSSVSGETGFSLLLENLNLQD